MAKEKIQIDESIKKNREFYFESMGLLSILFVFIVFVEIGKVGLILKVIMKFLFGDWYFLLLGYILFIGLYYLIKHKVVTFKSLRLNGFFLLVFSLMLLNQQAIYNYTKINNLKGFAGIWELYLSYIKYYDNSFIMGGGLIGASAYTFLDFLLGEIGIIILSVFLLIISLIFLTNNTVFTFFKKINVNLKVIDKIPNFFQKHIEKIDLTKIKEKKVKINSSIKVSINNLTDIKENMNVKLQEQFASDLEKMLINILELQKVEFQFIKSDIGISITRFYFKILYNFNIEIFKKKVIEILEINPYIEFNNNELTIDIKNKFKTLYTLRRCLESDKENDDNLIPIGIKLNKNLCYFDLVSDKHLYVIGDIKSGVKTFFRAFFVSILIKKKNQFYYIIDLKNRFEDFKTINNQYINYTNHITNLDTILEKLNYLIEERIEIFHYYKISQYEEFERVTLDSEFKKPERIFILIPGIEEIYKDNNYNIFENKLFYLLSVGEKYGLNFIFFEFEKLPLESKLKNYVSYNIIFKVSNIHRLSKIIENDMSMFLYNNGDAIFRDHLYLERIQTPFISKTEFQIIIQRLK